MTSLPNDVRHFDFCYPFSGISVSSAVNSFWLRLCRAVASVAKIRLFTIPSRIT
jgi:hypothetical protein